MVRERFTADVAPAALHGVEAALLQHDLSLADHHHRTSTHFCALKDVILHSLGEESNWSGNNKKTAQSRGCAGSARYMISLDAGFLYHKTFYWQVQSDFHLDFL